MVSQIPTGQSAPQRRGRCLLTWGVVTTLGVALAEVCLGVLLDRSAPVPAAFEDVLVRIAAGATLLCLPPLWWTTTSTCWQLLRGTMTQVPTSLVRRVVLLACGAVALTSLSPAHAGTSEETQHPRGRATTSQHTLDGLPLPDRASLPMVPSTPGDAASPPRTPHTGAHLVRSGETLWSIAADHLGRRADHPSIDALWRRIHALNAEVIGTDPDLIRPGQSLRLPTSHATPSTEPSVGHHHEGDRP